MLTDTHAHLDFPDFADDLPGVLDRARAAGVHRMVCIGTTVESSRSAIALAEKYDDVYAVIGIHPNAAEEAPEDAIEVLRELAKHPRVVAIGEIGLDYYRLPGAQLRKQGFRDLGFTGAEMPGEADADALDACAKGAQALLFEQQLELAVELRHNVVIHQRESWEDTLEILQRYTGKLRAVYHCFGEGPERAAQLLELGHLVSFTGIITFKNARLVQETAAGLPAGKFMVETDCPYLAPVPYRGKKCEPAYVRETAAFLAELRKVSLEELARETEQTANSFFAFNGTPA